MKSSVMSAAAAALLATSAGAPVPVAGPSDQRPGVIVLDDRELDAVQAGGFWSTYPTVEIGYFTFLGKTYPYFKPFKPVF